MPHISVSSLQGELLPPARESNLFYRPPSADSCSGGDTELTLRLEGLLLKHEPVLLPQRKLLLSVVHVLLLLRRQLQPVREQL